MKPFLYAFWLALLLPVNAKTSRAQDSADLKSIPIEFSFQVLRIDTGLADPFQEQILSGGYSANQAMDRIPDLVKRGQAEVLATLKMECKSGARAKGLSSKRVLEFDDDGIQTYPDGLQIELDPVLGRYGSIDLNMAIEFARKVKREILLRTVVTQVHLLPDEPSLLSRWQIKEETLFAIATVKHDGPVKLDEVERSNLYTDVTYYDSAANRNKPVARIVIPARSGNRAKSEAIIPTLVDVGGAIEYMARELVVEIDPVRNKNDATIDLNYKFEYGILPGGNGAKASRATYQSGNGSETFAPDAEKDIKLNETKLDGKQPGPSNWIATARIIVPETANPEEAFQAARTRQVNEPYELEIKAAKKKYISALADRYRKASAAGNAALATALKNEATILQSGKELPTVDPTNLTLSQLRGIYEGLLSTADANRDKNLSELKKQFSGN